VIQIEDFRLISDEVWYAAQAMLHEEKARNAGRKPQDGDTASRPRILNGLFWCPTHSRKLYVSGVNGKYMICRDCRAVDRESRPLYSQLPRGLSLQKTCETMLKLVRGDESLIERVIASCQVAAAALQAPEPQVLATAAARIVKLDRRIALIMRNPGETEVDEKESEAELKRLRRDRGEALAVQQAAQAAATRSIEVPSETEVRVLLQHLGDILIQAANLSTPGVAEELRLFLDRFTGGRIELEQMGERLPGRGWLRGRFRGNVITSIVRSLTGKEIASSSPDQAIVMDFFEETSKAAASAEEVKRLYDQGLLTKQIARQLSMPRSAVTAALDVWYSARGLERPDGRSRRASLAVKHLTPPLYQEIADRVKAMAEEGTLFDEIATALNVDRNTLTSAWKHWHTSRGLPVPDGRTRRKSLSRKSGNRKEDGKTRE